MPIVNSMHIRKFLAILFFVSANAAIAGRLPVAVAILDPSVSDFDSQIANRVVAYIASDPNYAAVTACSKQLGAKPCIAVLLNYTDMQDGITAVFITVLVNDETLPIEGYIGGGRSFCTQTTQDKCVFEVVKIIQSSTKNLPKFLLNRSGKLS
jgi:hypothetical protein